MTPKSAASATATMSPSSAASAKRSLKAVISERMQPGVVYTTFHHFGTGANVITTDFSDWATNCPEYKVTAVEVRLSNHQSEWQRENALFRQASRRIGKAAE